MNKKKIYLLVCTTILAAVAITFFLLLSPAPGLTRCSFEPVNYLPKKKIKVKRLTLEKNDSTFSVTKFPGKFNKGFTLKGTALYSKKNSSQPKSVKVNRPPAGSFIMDFHYYFLPIGKKHSQLVLEINCGEESRQIQLKPEPKPVRFQLPVLLDKDAVLTFSMKGKGLAIIGEPAFYPDEKEAEKQLVFIISVDTLRYDYVGGYNPQKNCTPRIDAFARDAVVFNNAYSTSSWTLPAHTSLFTGDFAHSHELNHTKNEENGKMGPTLFAPLQRKFLTVSFNGDLFVSQFYGFARDFDYYFEATHDTSNPKAAKLLFQKTANYIQADKFRLPTCFFLHTYQVHSLFYPEKEVLEKIYPGDNISHEPFDIMEFTKYGQEQFRTGSSGEEKERMLKMYEAGVHTFDYRFGKFIDFLKARNLYDNALIVILSDHGEEFGEHSGWAHGHALYDELIRIPLIIKFPHRRYAGSSTTQPVSIVDVLPTILDYYHLTGEEEENNSRKVNGISLLPLIEGKGAGANRPIFAYLAKHARYKTASKTTVITGRHKLIFNETMSEADRNFFISPPPEIPTYELYDLEADPGENQNIFESDKRTLLRLFKILKGIKYKKTIKGAKKKNAALEKELKSLGYLN